MLGIPKSFERLAAELQRLPGIGAKSAARLAYHLLRSPKEEAERLARSITEARAAVVRCSICNTLTEEDPCAICSDPRRDPGVICVVEPLKGVGPEEIEAAGLSARMTPEVKEVILATNPNVEGEATALYLARRLKDSGVRLTRIAFGLPVGGDIEYADEVTMARSLENRKEL